MRIAHCTVALLVLASLARVGRAQAPPAAQPVDFTVFYQGRAVGAEQVTLSRTPQGITISGTERIGPPLNITTRKAEIRYTADWRPLECIIEGSLRDQQALLHTSVAGTTATSDFTQGTTSARKSDEIAADALLLPNIFFGAYEALAARLPGTRAGDRVNAYLPPQAPVIVTVKGVSDDRVRTQDALLQIRRYAIEFANPNRPAEIEVWIDPNGRLLRLTIPGQSFDVIRTDIASITSRREALARPNDELVHIPAYGFSLAGTLSQPATKPAPAFRFPAIVLVSGSDPTDRDETLAGVPVFGQLASALADAGFVVVRYDKRGAGQSGGRAENATLADYSDDAISVVKFLRRRKDVDPRRVAVLGYGEGGAIAAFAASRGGDIAALALVAAPGVSGAALVLEQQRHLLGLMNIPDAEKRAKIDLQEKLQQAVISGTGFDRIPANLRSQADTPWFRSFLTFDPDKVLRKTDQPILVVAGELDRQIAASNADKLETIGKARKGRAGQLVKVVKIAGINHLLVPAVTGEVDEYDRLTDKTISRDVVGAIGSWLKDSMRAR
jgi:pimeloyl-ACP methyl ester carboxylesterase